MSAPPPAQESTQPRPRETLLAAQDVTMHFPLRGGLFRTVKGHVKAVDGVSLRLERGETLAIVGESGCGKTTLARLLLRLLEPSAGKIFFMGHDLTTQKLKAVREDRRHLQMVFQDPMSSLDPRMTIKNIVGEPLVVHRKPDIRPLRITALSSLVLGFGAIALVLAFLPIVIAGVPSFFGFLSADAVFLVLIGATFGGLAILSGLGLWRQGTWAWELALLTFAVGFGLSVILGCWLHMLVTGFFVASLLIVRKQFVSAEDISRRVVELLEIVGLKKEHLNRFPHEFSGGQRQRINVARALALNPDVIILDEPTSALDVSVQAQILNLLMELQRNLGLTYLFITHDLSVVYHIADRVAVMYAGKIVELSETEEIFRNPQHPYTKALISAAPVADPSVKAERIVLKGEVPSPSHPPPGCRFHPRCWLAFEPCNQVEPQLFETGGGHQVACYATARDLGLWEVGGPDAARKRARPS